MKTNLFILGAIVFAAFSCKKADSELPVISSVRVNNSSETVNVEPGESILVTALITDNEDLNQFKIDIHHDFDGHSHKTMTARYSEIRIVDISGSTHNLSETFIIPENTSSGAYHGTIRAVDKEGNQSENVLFYFNVVRSGQPVIAITAPQSVAAGTNFGISGTITGTANLSLIQIRAIAESTGNSLYTQSFNVASAQSTTWDAEENANISIAVPENLTGKIKFRVRAEDINGNNTIFEKDIVVN